MAWRIAKGVLYALLAGNVGLYALHGTPAETLDTAAWLVLLGLFEWETGGWGMPPRNRRVVHALRAIATLAVLVACTGYAFAREWLDFANACTWLMVVLLLEAQVRVPDRHVGLHGVRRLLALACYVALAGFVVAWTVDGVRGDPDALLDAWDAALWLLAFVAIELNLFGLQAGRADAPPSTAS